MKEDEFIVDHIKPATPHPKMTLAKLFLGNEKITPWVITKSIFIWILIFIAGYYVILSTPFLFPEQIKNSVFIATTFLSFVAVYFLYRDRDKNERIKHLSKVKMSGFMILSLLLYPFVFYVFLVLGPANAYTKVFGKPYEEIIYYEDKEDFSTSSKCSYKFKSPAANFALIKDICLSKTQFSALPSDGAIQLIGKESLVGRTVEAYHTPEDPSAHMKALQLKGQIDERWIKYRKIN